MRQQLQQHAREVLLRLRGLRAGARIMHHHGLLLRLQLLCVLRLLHVLRVLHLLLLLGLQLRERCAVSGHAREALLEGGRWQHARRTMR